MPHDRRQKLAFQFLRAHAENGLHTTKAELAATAEWKSATVDAHFSKEYGDFVVVDTDGFRVKKEFLRVTEEAFLQYVTQKKRFFSQYNRYVHPSAVIFDFFLPVSKEDKLRRAIDELFYRDTVARRLEEIPVDRLREIFAVDHPQTMEECVARLCDCVSERFGGYSVSHVQGRFRASSLATREEVGTLLTRDQPYLIDETTAVARFIIPCNSDKQSYDPNMDDIHSIISQTDSAGPDAIEEARSIRALFFHLFVEAVVREVDGEEQIWMLESGIVSKLFIWEKRRTLKHA